MTRDIVKDTTLKHWSIIKLIKDINKHELLKYYLKEIPGYPFPILHEANNDSDLIDNEEDDNLKNMIKQLKYLIIINLVNSDGSTYSKHYDLISHGVYVDSIFDSVYDIQSRIIGPIDASWVIHCNVGKFEESNADSKPIYFPCQEFINITTSDTSFRLFIKRLMKQ